MHQNRISLKEVERHFRLHSMKCKTYIFRQKVDRIHGEIIKILLKYFIKFSNKFAILLDAALRKHNTLVIYCSMHTGCVAICPAQITTSWV